MNTVTRKLPLSTVTLIFGMLSIPLAFMRHLCSLAVVLGLLSIAFYLVGLRTVKRNGSLYSAPSIRHVRWGGRAAMIGTAAGIVMWVLWRSGLLLR